MMSFATADISAAFNRKVTFGITFAAMKGNAGHLNSKTNNSILLGVDVLGE
jgi:hypothetical protein